MDKNKITVNINGNEYIIRGDESEEETLKIASYVDKQIKELTSRNNKLNPTFASVLSALNITNELFKLRKQYEKLENSFQDPIRQLNELKIEYNNLLKENAKVEEKVSAYAKDTQNRSVELKAMKEQYESLYNEYMSKNEELVKVYRENEVVKREKENRQKELEKVKMELSESRVKLIELQNQLLQNQIDLVKVKKEFDEFKMNYSHDRENELQI